MAQVVEVDEIYCLGCGRADDDANFLLCDHEQLEEGVMNFCTFGCHFYCIDPPLSGIPINSWKCPICTNEKYLSNQCIYCSSRMYNDRKSVVKCQTNKCDSTAHIQCISAINDSVNKNTENKYDKNNKTLNKLENWQCSKCKNDKNVKLPTSRDSM